MSGAEIGQLDGGRRTYFSDGGRVDWTNACLKSHDFGVTPLFAASAIRRRSSICEMTGANVSVLSQLWGSRLPNATILYFARCGSPCSLCFMVEIAMDGRVGPRMDFSC